MGGGSGGVCFKNSDPTPAFSPGSGDVGLHSSFAKHAASFPLFQIRVRTLLIWNNMKERVDYNNISSLYHLCSLDLLRQSKQKQVSIHCLVQLSIPTHTISLESGSGIMPPNNGFSQCTAGDPKVGKTCNPSCECPSC